MNNQFPRRTKADVDEYFETPQLMIGVACAVSNDGETEMTSQARVDALHDVVEEISGTPVKRKRRIGFL